MSWTPVRPSASHFRCAMRMFAARCSRESAGIARSAIVAASSRRMPVARPLPSRTISPPTGLRGVVVDPHGLERSAVEPERVVIDRPERDGAVGHRLIQQLAIRLVGAAAAHVPRVRVPPTAGDPFAGRRVAAWAATGVHSGHGGCAPGGCRPRRWCSRWTPRGGEHRRSPGAPPVPRGRPPRPEPHPHGRAVHVRTRRRRHGRRSRARPRQATPASAASATFDEPANACTRPFANRRWIPGAPGVREESTVCMVPSNHRRARPALRRPDLPRYPQCGLDLTYDRSARGIMSRCPAEFLRRII